MWMDDYQKFSDRDKEQFTRLVNLLLDKTFLLRERVDPREKALIIDRDYRFLERFFSVFQGYLALAGWELNMDGQLGVAALSNRYGTNRYRLNKVETYFLLVLRLIYLEESEKMTLRRDVVSTVRDLLEKMSLLNLLEKKLADKEAQAAKGRQKAAEDQAKRQAKLEKRNKKIAESAARRAQEEARAAAKAAE